MNQIVDASPTSPPLPPPGGPPGFHLLSKQALYPNQASRMSEATHEAYIRQLLESHRSPQVNVAWLRGPPQALPAIDVPFSPPGATTSNSGRSRARFVRIAVLPLMLAAGCVSVPPQRIAADRMGYGEVVADSWKRQTLLNVVRLRYADTPVFLEVTSIINSYSVGGRANASVEVPGGGGPIPFQAGGEGSWSNTPTVTYQPLMGERFTKSLLQPVPPSALFQLLQGGWPADLVLGTVATSVNGKRNSIAGVDAEPDFRRLVEALTRIQRSGGLSIRVDARQGGSAVIVIIRPGEAGSELSQDARAVQQMLGLEAGISQFDVVYGLFPKDRREIAVLSRSMLEIMLQLGYSIDVPATDMASGRVMPGQWKVGQAHATPLVSIKSGARAPADAYAAVPYHGNWYWIEDNDVVSKRTFTFLMILFSLAETGQSAAAPVVTVPSR